MKNPDALQARAKALHLHGLLAHWSEAAAAGWPEVLIGWEEDERARRSLERRLHESPGLIELATASAAGASAIWMLVQTLERVTSWPLNRQKLRLEVMKLEREIGPTSPIVRRERIEPFLDAPEVRSATKQLESNPLKASMADNAFV